MAQRTIDILQFGCPVIKLPNLDAVVVYSNEFRWVLVVKLNIGALLVKFLAGWLERFTPSFTHVPNDKLIAVFGTADRDEVALVARE